MNACVMCKGPNGKPPYGTCWVCSRNSRAERQKNPINPDFRKWLLDRDGHQCVECGETDMLVIDHIIPIIYGGKTTPDNLQVLCRSCNGSKSANSLYLEGQTHRLSRPPIVIWEPLVEELGGLVPAAIMSEVIGRPGYQRFGQIFEPEGWARRLGLSVRELVDHLTKLEANDFIRCHVSADKMLHVDVWAHFATEGLHPPQANSTRRHPSQGEDHGPEGSSTGRPSLEVAS